MTMGHRIAVMRACTPDSASNLMQCGTPMELYDRPQNIFTARFIGTPRMNMLPARISDDGRVVECFDLRLPVSAQFSEAARRSAGKPVSLGIRPEHIGVAHEVDWPQTCTVQARVDLVEPLGHEVIVHMHFNHEPLAGRLRSHALLPRVGEPFGMVINCEAMHLFDPASEQRLS
jgi:ABC-type sugar transport system ATPase subunit